MNKDVYGYIKRMGREKERERLYKSRGLNYLMIGKTERGCQKRAFTRMSNKVIIDK